MIENSEFSLRHIGPDENDISVMLEALELENLDTLIDLAVPINIREASETLLLPDPVSEAEALQRLKQIAGKNTVQTSLIGLGYYNNFTPGVIQRNILENPAWYTAYTPYQPEISQGRLEALINYQTLVSELTGCELSNASLLDEPTAVAEAMTLLYRVQKSSKNTFLLDGDALPQTKAVVLTRAEAMGINVVIGDPTQAPDDCFAVLYQYPGASGEVRDLTESIQAHHENGVLIGVAADLLALTLLTPPGELGVDVVVGSAQRFGVPMGFGGPHAGYIAVKEKYKRSLPGRLVGASIDALGNPAFRLALQTREQHIRREKATSNICTAQVLLAIIAGMYGVYHGPEGLTAIAQRTHSLMNDFALTLTESGYEIVTENWFDTITIRLPGEADLYIEKALLRGFNLRLIDSDHLGVSFDETTNREIVDNLLQAFTENDLCSGVASTLPEKVLRKSSFCQQPVFSLYRSETEMLRYIRRLSDKDLALDRTMIPLGSCTMKLNASTEMIPISWDEFANIHPFVPTEQRKGYSQLISELEDWLVKITGYAAVSLQPNAGSQGEFAGLLAIRSYHLASGDESRNICLIPASAHGTNAASAVMAGMKVVVVNCDENGNVDLVDLANKAEEYSETLSAIMITYPSTHGVYEEAVSDICDIVHEHGGQVYLMGQI